MTGRFRRYADLAKRGLRSAKQELMFAGLSYDQNYLLHMLWLRVNLPVPPLPEQNEQLVRQCREIGIAEWRIQTALNSRPEPYEPSS